MSKLREELIRAKNMADEERFKREKYETKLLDLEMKLNGICCTGVVFDAKVHLFDFMTIKTSCFILIFTLHM